MLFITVSFLFACKKNSLSNKGVLLKGDTLINKEINNKDTIALSNKANKDMEENGNDEFISKSLFEKWKGIYRLKQENQIDGWGRESTCFSELSLIKPDSCIFKSWLADENGKRYNKDDNYQEFIGGILATSKKDSIEFYTKRVVSGEDNSLSPLLTLTYNKNYFIYSLITSPPNNGVMKVSIEKLK